MQIGKRTYPRFSIGPRWLRMLAVVAAMFIIIPVSFLHGMIDMFIAVVWTAKQIIVRNWE